jgi:Kef-type K+ transport system membrane component KefB
MIFSSVFSLPVQDPVPVFAALLLIILFSPLVFNRLGIPGISGLIFSGGVPGPHGQGVLERDESVVLNSTIGLLYIMFLAGLEMDDFRQNKNQSLLFGSLTFIMPPFPGWLGSYYLLGNRALLFVLLAGMFSTHTMGASPIICRLALTGHITVTLIPGGTAMTGWAVLIILAVITNLQKPDVSPAFWVHQVALLVDFVFLVLWGGPRLRRWFFKTLAFSQLADGG